MSTESSSDPADKSADEIYSVAYEFGWRNRLPYDAQQVKPPVSFESVEVELKERWSKRQSSVEKQLPWETARAAARDAWDRVFDALAEDSRPKE